MTIFEVLDDVLKEHLNEKELNRTRSILNDYSKGLKALEDIHSDAFFLEMSTLWRKDFTLRFNYLPEPCMTHVMNYIVALRRKAIKRESKYERV